MEWVEVTGKTVDAAKEAALDQLGVAERDAELIVVSEPKAGLFGRMRGEARVRARVRPVGPRPKRQRGGGRDRARSSGAARGSGREGRGAGREGGGGAANGKEGGRAAGTEPVSAAGAAKGDGAPRAGGEGAGRSRSARRRRSRSRARLAAGEGDGAAAPGGGDGERGAEKGRVDHGRREQDRRGLQTKEEPEMAEGMTLEEQGAVAKEFLEGLLDQYGFEASVELRVLDEETVEVAADGEGLGMLVGPKGTTLAALQDVTRTVVQRRFPSRTDRILVDVAGYRERRAAALQRFSRQVATEVIESGTERALEPMSPADRKVVHDAVNEIEGVVTRSEGEDPDRFVVISPAG